MNPGDLINAWDLAIERATIEPKRTNEMDEMLETRTGLRAGLTPSEEFLHGAPWDGGIGT